MMQDIPHIRPSAVLSFLVCISQAIHSYGDNITTLSFLISAIISYMLKEHYEKVKETIQDAQLCVVSKKRSEEEILSYYEEGERIFGENHALEFVEKAKDLPKDIKWQFIGHLQRNKVKMILPYVDRIQSLDNTELAKVIEKEAAKLNKKQKVLVEFHLAEEDTNKTGLPAEEADAFFEEVMQYEHLAIEGIMVMGPHTDDEEKIRQVFEEAHALFMRLKEKYPQLHILSMGMSDDYPIAVQCGSTMVRVGTYLFEEGE